MVVTLMNDKGGVVQGVLMDGAANGGSMTTFATTSVLTDLTLALLQDSGWCAPTPLAPALTLPAALHQFSLRKLCTVVALKLGPQ